jgi:hypothetical protein
MKNIQLSLIAKLYFLIKYIFQAVDARNYLNSTTLKENYKKKYFNLAVGTIS